MIMIIIRKDCAYSLTENLQTEKIELFLNLLHGQSICVWCCYGYVFLSLILCLFLAIESGFFFRIAEDTDLLGLPLLAVICNFVLVYITEVRINELGTPN
jgi:hypothetical protein